MNPFRSIAVALLVLVAGCAGTAPTNVDAQTGTAPTNVDAQTGTAPEDATPPTITVSATGRVTADPDRALLRVAVVATADEADAARGQVAADVQRMRAALRDAGVPDDRVRTTFFRVDADRDPEGGTFQGYRATHAFEVEVAPDRAGEIIDVAVGNGATRVDSVQFTLADDTVRTLRTEAIGLAVDDARADADAVAAALNATISGVASASTGQPAFVPFDARVAEAAGGAGTTIEPGPVTVTATVTVTYRIEG